MKNTDCLSEQELILHYYKELHPEEIQVRHLADCENCAKRFATLCDQLDRFPDMNLKLDHAVGTRMAARVNEQLQGRRRNWLPALAASVVATAALVITIYEWSPQQQQIQTVQLVQPTMSTMTTMNFNDDMPDVDFLEDLDVLKDLDLLRQIEGV